MSNQRKWIVIDGENRMAWDTQTETGKTFRTYAAAYKEAVNLASDNPGAKILICKAQTIIFAPIGKLEAWSA